MRVNGLEHRLHSANFQMHPSQMHPRKIGILLLALILPLSSQVMVDTFAGGKVRSSVPAQDVPLSYINGMAWDSNGNLVLCQTATNRIRRIRPDGIIETVAGTGTTGYS